MTVLLDSLQHHINMRTSFTDGFKYVTDTTICIQFIRSHKHLEISLFLSVDNFQAMSAELRRHRHVVLYIFYNKLSTTKQKMSNSANGQILFFFREPQLSEYLRHTAIIYYSDRAAAFQESGDLEQADEYYWTAHQQCAALDKELKQKIDTRIAIDAQDSTVVNPLDEAILQPYIT